MDETPVPFAGLRDWLRSRNFFLTDKQTCLRLFVVITGYAYAAGVPEFQLAQALKQAYHPRAKRPAAASDKLIDTLASVE